MIKMTLAVPIRNLIQKLESPPMLKKRPRKLPLKNSEKFFLNPEAATREMKDAQLGFKKFSKGLKSKWNPTKLNDDLDDIMDRRHRKIERK